MRLSNVEIFGFKSFLTRVEIPFGRGITSIVGPNGCGKSNIVEAIRWVLGEQRAGAVRGHRMEDVIFSGTRQRKPLGMSEVSLTIDNSSHILPIEFSEVTVTRRLFRSGESDYLLNKVPCRLLDIQNLLMDTGLGPGAYSVMEQGMVDEIISERTENRRRILEEAAGITKYKTRRRSTWNKLESTQADLTRLEDLIGEVKRQVDYLGRQVGRARRYKTLRQEWEQLELLFGRHRFFQIQEQLKPLRRESDELSKRSVSGRTELTTQETELEKRRLAVTTLEKDLQTVGVELTRCVEQLHERERGLVAVRERRGARQQFIRRSTEERDRQQQQLAASRQQREQTLGALADAESRLSSDGGRLQSQEESTAEAEAAWQRGQSALEAANARLRTALGGREECGRTVERLQAEAAGLERTREHFASEQSGLGTALDGLSRDGAAAQQELAGLESRLTAVEGDFAAARERQKEVEEQLRRAVEERGAFQRSLEANAARLQVLEKVRSGFEGHSQGVRNLMLDPERRELFRGVLADLIEVESEYYLAVETAVGDALHALVADSEDAAFEAVRSLRDAAGRAGVFPLDWNFPPPSAAPVEDLPGV
ncbi:MAG: AAA family ATPase, partial [Gemmatimonadetes bacterium]|nr:AAA family ATPase [Gemmatimonadota bacterium]